MIFVELEGHQRSLYQNNVKNRDFGKEVPQNFLSGASDHCRRQDTSEDKNSEVKPQQAKTDSSGCFGVSPGEFEEITGVKFISSLQMENDSVCQKIHRLGEKLQKKHKFSTSKIGRFLTQFSSAVSFVKKELRMEQFWRGQYYYKEIVSPSFSGVFLRKINPSIGWGVFAARSFKPREYIAEYTGVIRKRRKSDHYNAYCFEYMAEPGKLTPFIIDAKERSGIARYINHSEKPNLEPMLATIGLQTHLILLTTRAIQPGEQLCYDYGPAYWKKRSPPVTL